MSTGRWDRRTFLMTGASNASMLAAAAAGCVAGRRDAGLPGGRPASSSSDGSDEFAELRGFCDGAAPLGPADYAAHLAKVQRGLSDAGRRALIVEPGPTMFYLSGVRWWPSERAFLLVVPASGRPWWICPAFEAGRARERAGDDADLRLWQEDEDPYRLVARGLGGTGPVAVDPDMRHFVYAGVAEALAPRAVLSGRSVVVSARIRKTENELALLDRANQATKAALRRVASMTRVGMRESELRRWVHAAQSAAGLSNVWSLVLFGPNAAFPHGTGRERTLEAGDFVLVDTGGALHGYQSDITRTWSMGPVPAAARRIFDVVREAQRAAFARLGPGVTCGEVDAAARAVIDEAGFGPDYAVFTHRLGHGIGIQGHEDPYLVRGSDRVLEPGMTMSNEPGIYLPGRVGVRIEDIVAITESGHRVFGPTVSSFDAPV